MPTSLIYYDGSKFKLNYINNIAKINHVEIEYLSGLSGVRYAGYHNDDPTWFNTAIPQGDTNLLTEINNFSSSFDYAQEEYYSWQWIGYFRASTTDEYTFYLNSDDGSYLWIGDTALSGFTVANSLVNNGGPHGPTEVSGSISLIEGVYYPIRIQFGEIGGGDILTVSFSSSSISKTTNGSSFYFHY